MKKYLLLALAAIGTAGTALADDETGVSIIDVDGTTVSTATLASIEKIEFADSTLYMTVVSDDEQTETYRFKRSLIGKFEFAPASDIISGIDKAPAAAPAIGITAEGTTLSFTGLKAGQTVSVYAMNGRLALSAKAKSADLTLSTQTLAPGVYIVRAAGKAIKIIKK